MPTFIERKDYEFLLLTTKFCNKIENYRSALNLDLADVEQLKSDNELFAYVFSSKSKYSSCIESFARYKIQNMRVNFNHLAQCCKNSKNYTIAIGTDLGIEIPVFAFQAN
jgi:hypothetical protein